MDNAEQRVERLWSELRNGPPPIVRELRLGSAVVVDLFPERAPLRAAMVVANERYQRLLTDINAGDHELAAAESEVNLTRAAYQNYLNSAAAKPRA